ncbi:hypothetical protein ACQKWADRAFT_317185 [Trichoderma austrokoningii]
MKISAISLSIFLFASLSSSLNIRSPPGREEGKEVESGPPRWPPEVPPPVDDIKFSWCQSYGRAETCSSKNLKHGSCYDFGVLDPKILDMLEEVDIQTAKACTRPPSPASTSGRRGSVREKAKHMSNGTAMLARSAAALGHRARRGVAIHSEIRTSATRSDRVSDVLVLGTLSTV